MKLQLKAHPPFSFSSVIHSHGWIQLAPFKEDSEKCQFSYILELDTGKVVNLRVSEGKEGVVCEVEGALSAAEETEITRKLSWMLALDQDFTQFYALANVEPKLMHAVQNSSGRILRSATLFEDVIKTILTTNTLWAATRRMTTNLVSQFGRLVDGFQDQKAFPTPERLVGVGEHELREKTRLGYRAPYIVSLAQGVSSGGIDLEGLKDPGLSTAEVRKKLLEIKGVGPYASANLLMLLGHYDFIPVDSWAVKVVSYEWHAGRQIGAKEVEAAFEPWGKWKGLAFWLWDWSYNNQQK